MPAANVSYEIKAVPGRGNALVATELILKGEVIFTEKPSIWHSRSTSKGFCSSCGKLILLDASAKDESSAGHIYCSNSRSRGGVSNTDSLKDGIKTSCIASYCCDLCRDDAELAGHRWLCGEAFVKRYEELTQSDDDVNLGHLGLALTGYCKVAALYMRKLEGIEDLNDEKSLKPDISPLEVANLIFDGFCTSDYCRCVHAYRGGSLMISDVMFEEIISPAYFSSRLETPLNIIKSIFGDPKPWGTSPKGIKGREIFLNSELFSEKYFRNLMGLFMVNVLHVRIEKLIEKEVFDRILKIDGVEVDKDALQSFEIEKVVEDIDNVEKEDGKEGEKKEDEKECKKVAILKNYGAGLFSIYSMLNHSCECNTFNQGGDKAEVSLIASMDILKGTEITTTYLQDSVRDSSRKIRKQALSQYLFLCDCVKCTRELDEKKELKIKKNALGASSCENDDADEESSDDDDY